MAQWYTELLTPMVWALNFDLYFVEVLGMELKSSAMLDKCSATMSSAFP